MKRKYLAIIGYTLAVLFNIPHLVGTYLMAHDGGFMSEYYIWISMLVLDFGILVLAIYDRNWETQIFAWVIFVLNLLYYWAAIPFPDLWGDWVRTLPGLLLSSIPAFFVYFFSELIADQFRPELADNSRQLDLIRYELDSFSLTIDNKRPVIEIFTPLLASYASQVGKPIKVSGVKASVCKCGVFHVAGSNREGNRKCHNCDEVIDWK